MLYDDKNSVPDDNSHVEDGCRLPKSLGVDCNSRLMNV
jgi:hypothetical protein